MGRWRDELSAELVRMMGEVGDMCRLQGYMDQSDDIRVERVERI